MSRKPALMLLLLVCLSGSAWGAVASPTNWVVNGDFKSAQGWSGTLTTKPGRGGEPALFLENAKPDWNSRTQGIVMPDPPPAVLEISGWMKTDKVVRGARDWENARISVVFYDSKGARLGDWPPTVASVVGTHDWDYYSYQYPLPKDSASVTVEIGLGNCSGRAWFSDIRCLAYDYDSKPLAPGQAAHPSLKPARSVKTDNWIKDPGFETLGSGDWGQARVTGNGHASEHCAAFTNETPSWNQGQQDIPLGAAKPVSAVLSGWVRTEKVVRGAETWESARLGIDFRDPSGKQLGGWQAVACQVVGDTGWAHYEKSYAVPPGTGLIHIEAGLGNCTGRAWFDDLSLVLYDASGSKIPAVLTNEQVTDTKDWYPYKSPAAASDAPLDLSFLNDKPAGTHGFVTVKDGHFAFADGARVRFYGTDLVGPRLFLPHDEADLVAERLAKLGVNILRLHFLDNDWGELSLFDSKADNTQVFLPGSLDKMDYLIAALKKRGIYVYPDWSVGRKFREGDKVPGSRDLEMGAKTVIHFSRRVIELNKKYAEMLLTHVNPYTGLALKDDPVYVGNEIVNESSIFTGFAAQDFPQPFWDELQGQYKAWGGKGKVTRFKFDWDTQKLIPTQNPENADASLRFLLQTEIRTNLEMRAFLRKLSPHALLAGSNMGLPILGDIKANSVMDFMDTHAYWDHPQIWNIAGGWANVAKAPMTNRSQLLNPFQGTLIPSLTQAAVAGMPLIVTEWNDCVPNEYRLEGPALMAAYGALQDWDGLLQFDFGPTLMGSEKLSNFAINSRPDNEPLYQAGALMFRLGLLKPSDVTVTEGIPDKDVLADGSKSGWLTAHAWLPYVARVVKRFTGAKAAAPPDLSALDSLHNDQAKVLKSSTGEETLDYGKGVLKLDSPSVQGFVGGIGTGEPLKAGDLTLVVAKRNPWAAVMAVSMDGQPLAKSKKFLLVATARAENSGQVYNGTRTALKDPGGVPILIQGVSAKVTVKVGNSGYRVMPLDESGNSGKSLKTSMGKGSLGFTISPGDKTAYYLVESW